jgi:phosphatidylserine/phosphatidylglycerophosphate/cardiolipin synthase-like enzyme
MGRAVRRVVVLAVVAGVIALGLHAITASHRAARPQLPTRPPAGAAADSLIIEPNEGITPVYDLLRSPRRTLDLTMYELVDPTAELILATDASRGVRVRVLLDRRLEGQRNAAAYDYLRARGVGVAWSSSRYFATHEKTFVIDGSEAVVMSLNLADEYYATTRDVAVVDHDARDAQAVESVFDADFAGHSTGTPAADDLVWSPTQSEPDVVALIDGARHSVAMESEELSSRPVIDALVRAARRGVQVTVAMTYQSDWAPAFDAVTASGGTVGVLHGETPVYIHAKLLAVDAGTPQGRVLIGSQNLSDASLRHDRELGIVLLAPALVNRVANLINADVSAGQRWR